MKIFAKAEQDFVLVKMTKDEWANLQGTSYGDNAKMKPEIGGELSGHLIYEKLAITQDKKFNDKLKRAIKEVQEALDTLTNVNKLVED